MNYKTIRTLFILILMIFQTTLCKESAKRNSKANLLKTTAEERKNLIGDIRYSLHMDLTDNEKLWGKTEIRFQLTSINEISLDFENGDISNLEINSVKALNSPAFFEGSIKLPIANLKIGDNTVIVEYSKPYSRNGSGLHRFQDPQDNSIYFYTQFEAFHANKVFPCFDQPDLKANFQLNLKTPKDFKAISSTTPKILSNGEQLNFIFPASKKFSTYLFSIIAGPYSEWSSNYKSIPLRLFARKSMAKFVKSDEWFQITRQGFQFFEDYFSVPYPFEKYDQIIVPEFNAGAMENVGAVTFSERFLTRGEITRNQREATANVILHEMAHMWFGNLVTMQWWNGLWLNESFATYMASLAQFQATEFTESWITFFQKMKIWAYKEDQLTTTHSIEANVADTNEAFTNFDGITYGKGASVLKQLAFYVGENNFRKGVRDYLKLNSYKNANLSDFLASIEKSFGKELKSWSSEWLEKKGLNEIQADFTCLESRISEFKILQENSKNSDVLRSHKTKIQLMYFSKTGLRINAGMDSEYGGSSTNLAKLKGQECPIFVFLNSEDLDYVKFRIDPISLNNLDVVLKNLTDKELLTKSVIWAAYWDMVLDGKISIATYADFARKHMESEKNERILRFVLPTIHSDSGISYYSSLFWEDYRKEKDALGDLRSYYKRNLLNSEKGSDSQKVWFYGYLSVSDPDLPENDLIQLLEGQWTIEGLKIDQDMRWNILQKLSSGNLPVIKELVRLEKQKDNTQRGKDFALSCEASYGSYETKEKFLRAILRPNNEYSNTTLRIIANSLFPINQKTLQSKFSRETYSGIGKIEKFRDESFMGNYIKSLIPSTCNEKNLNRINDYITNRNIHPSTKKNLLGLRDNETSCIAIQKKTKSR